MVCVAITALASFLTGLAPATAEPPAKYASIEVAVAAAAIEADVVDQLHKLGHVDAAVLLDQAAAATNADRVARGAEPRKRIEAYAAGLAPARMAAREERVEVLQDLRYLGVLLMRFQTEDELLRIANLRGITAIAAERTVHASLAQSLAAIHQPDVEALGFTGSTKAVAVIDTGIDYTQPAFGSCAAPGLPDCKVKSSTEVAPDDGQLDDPTSPHGTNVSGVVVGVAPDAQLLVYDVFSGAQSTTTYVRAAVNDVISRKAAGEDIAALNLSIASDTTGPCPDLIDLGSAVNAGILPVVASGNAARTNGVSWPACLPSALSVGATYDDNVGPQGYIGCSDPSTALDKIACFSNSGPSLGMLAPGAEIIAGDETFSFSGTSQAAPHVAGAAAVLAERFPGATAGSIRFSLTQSGPVITDPRNGIARHRLDLFAAIHRPSQPAADILLRPTATPGAPAVDFYFGTASYRHLLCDLDGDGVDGIVAVDGGTWYIRSTATAGFAELIVLYGAVGYVPVCGDWDDDGTDGIGVYVNGGWYLRNTATPGPPEIVVSYGAAGYEPVVGDWAGTGSHGIGVYVNGLWLLRNTPSAGQPQLNFAYGATGYSPVVGDWDGDGTDGIGVYVGGAWFLRETPTPGQPAIAYAYGAPSYTPVVGDYDGDGIDGSGVRVP